jgi:flavin-dependent dehydrogenase
VRIEAPYPRGVAGRFISRTHFDSWLLDKAIASGVEFRDDTRAVAPETEGPDARGERRVTGVRVQERGGTTRTVHAPVTIAADGRRSTLAFGLGLARHPARPRRWAVGAYFEGVCGVSSFGEMHIREGHYIGVAPLPGGVVNACLVAPDLTALRSAPGLPALLTGRLHRDPILGPRFSRARLVTRPIALGPLAVDSGAAGTPGLLLAGDAAGFIDPMTGDGLYFAMRGGELAARAALLALSGQEHSPHDWLAARRRREFRWKQRFDRTLRLVVSEPRAVSVGSRLAKAYPGLIEQVVRVAGDVGRGAANAESQQSLTESRRI